MIVVDRIEGETAVLEVDGKSLDFPVTALPEGTVEGDELVFSRRASSADESAERLERLRGRLAQGKGEFEL